MTQLRHSFYYIEKLIYVCTWRMSACKSTRVDLARDWCLNSELSLRLIACVSIVNAWGTTDIAKGKARMIYKQTIYIYPICLHSPIVSIYIPLVWKFNVSLSTLLRKSFSYFIYFQYSTKICSLNNHYEINRWNNYNNLKHTGQYHEKYHEN